MAIFLPHNIPVISSLREEGFVVNEQQNAGRKRILFLNIMPEKQRAELDFARVLANVEGFDVELIPVKIAGQVYKTTPQEYVETFYEDWTNFKNEKIDGVIITGAPLENMPFEEVRYWPQLCELMDWCRANVPSTLYICWAAQAGVYHFDGINKHCLKDKMFGVFPQNTLQNIKLMEGLIPGFLMPHSRHTEVRKSEFPSSSSDGLRIVAYGEYSGVGIAATAGEREVFVFGHPEYAKDTLHREYRRDLSKGLSIKAPENYYADATENEISFSWYKEALTLYHNWVRYY